jgi:hypothetical protein
MRLIIPILEVSCCAGAASGSNTAAPPRDMLNSRRLIVAPRLRSGIVTAKSIAAEGAVDVRFGS